MPTQEMTPWSRRLKQCQNCMKGETDERPMLSCAACKRCYYCVGLAVKCCIDGGGKRGLTMTSHCQSRQCQKADWTTHKPLCDFAKRTRQGMKEDIQQSVVTASGIDRIKADVISRKWVQQFRSVLNSVTFAALDLRDHPERRFTHVLAVTVRPTFTAKSLPQHDLDLRKAFVLDDAKLVRWEELTLTEESFIGLKASQAKIESLRSRYPESIGGCTILFVMDCNIARVVPAVFEALPHPECFNKLIQPDWKTLLQRRIEQGEPF